MAIDLQHDVLARAVCRVSAVFPGSELPQTGTGFLISPTRALTCAHCVVQLDDRGEPVRRAERVMMRFTECGGDERAARVLVERFDPGSGVDFAVLEFDDPLEAAAVLPLAAVGSPVDDLPWRGFGHPKSALDPLWVGGKVRGRVRRRENDVMQLLCPEARDRLRGISGAPVVVANRVVAMVSEQLIVPDEIGEAQPGHQTLIAVTIPELLARDESLTSSLKTPGNFFISYKRETREHDLARALDERLRRDGHEVFLDVNMEVGTRWAEELRRRLDACHFFVPLISAESLASSMFWSEVRAAYRRRRRTGLPRFLPVRIGRVALPYELHLYLGELQWLTWESLADTEQVVSSVAGVGSRLTLAVASLGERRRPGPTPVADSVPETALQGGALRLSDPYYVKRQPDERAARLTATSGVTFVVYAPSQYGKSSLLARYLDACHRAGKCVLRVDFRGLGEAPNEYATFLTDLRVALCLHAHMPIPSAPLIRESEFQGFVDGLLEQKQGRVVLAFDGVDRVARRPYSETFFSMLRRFHDCRADGGVWETLDMAFAISTEPKGLIRRLDRSPFNVATKAELRPFELAHYVELNARFGANLDDDELRGLLELLGGHPYLTRIAFFEVSSGRMSFAELMSRPADSDGPFGSTLRALLSRLTKRPNLVTVFREVDTTGDSKDGAAIEHLIALGVLQRTHEGVRRYTPSNLLYAQFLRDVI